MYTIIFCGALGIGCYNWTNLSLGIALQRLGLKVQGGNECMFCASNPSINIQLLLGSMSRLISSFYG